jgi:hypothetical protein
MNRVCTLVLGAAAGAAPAIIEDDQQKADGARVCRRALKSQPGVHNDGLAGDHFVAECKK